MIVRIFIELENSNFIKNFGETETSWGRRFKNLDLALENHFEFNLNKFYIGVVTNFTYELYRIEILDACS